MENNITELVFILDRSGSMRELENDTIGGYNSFIEKQKKEPGEAFLTTILFDDYYEVLHGRTSIKEVQPLTTNEYYARGWTALLDAVGKAIEDTNKKIDKLPEQERPAKVLFVITTDGLENSSKEYTFKHVKEKIQHYTEDHGWEFLFFGANMDAIGVASGMGIRADRAVRYANDSAGVSLNYCEMSEVASHYRRCSKIDDDWKKKIEKDYAKRGDKNKK
ncbi:MAG TPA: VWA domain-containing protein [Clostridia bacterium]|jgi:hypothetical protein|nr:VWA domain-containing protein [Clostridia bacterium]